MGDKSWQKKFKDNIVEMQVLKTYDLQVEKIKSVRKGLKIKTERGYRFLKEFSGSEEDLMFIYNVTEGLAREGFYRLARFMPTKYGDPFVRTEDKLYYLTDWIDGKECDLKKPLVLEESIRTLAQLHKTSGKLKMSMENRSRTGRWPEIFNGNMLELQEFRNIALQKMFPTEFDSLFLDNLDHFYLQGQHALENLEKSCYRGGVEAGQAKEVLCHKDFVGRNLIKAKDSEIYIIDFDHCSFDQAVYDLGRFLSKYLPKHGWDQEVARFILNTYNSIQEISKEEFDFLRTMLFFPRKFYRLASQYYQQKKEWTEEDFLRKIRRIIKKEQARTEFLATFNWG